MTLATGNRWEDIASHNRSSRILKGGHLAGRKPPHPELVDRLVCHLGGSGPYASRVRQLKGLGSV